MDQAQLYELPTYTRSAARANLLLLLFGLLASFLAADSWAAGYLAWRWQAHPILGTPLLPRSLPLAGLAALSAVGLLAEAVRRRGASPSLALVGLPLFFLPALVGPLYPPGSLFGWVRALAGEVPLAHDLASSSSLRWMLFALFVVPPILRSLLHLASERSRGDIHGSSRWASVREIREAGLLEAPAGRPALAIGHLLAGGPPAPLLDSKDNHVLVFAPSGSGKTTAFFTPNLLTWKESVLVLDPKGELWTLTAGYRRKCLGNLCLRFSPTALDGSGARLNPLDAIPAWPRDVEGARDLANILVNPQGRPDQDPSSRDGFIGVFKQILKAEHDPGFSYEWTTPGGEPTPTHPVVTNELNLLVALDHRTASGIVATALSHLELFSDPVVIANTSATDVTVHDLRCHEKPVSLYLTTPPGDTDRLLVLLRIILNQYLRTMTRQLDYEPKPAARRPLLLVLDEFPVLGKLDVLERSLAYMRSYGIRVLLAIQSLNQIFQIYGQHESITANCNVQIALAPNDYKTAELLSKSLGSQTVSWDRASVSNGPGRVSTTPADVGRPLLTAEELRRLPRNRALVLYAGLPPILARRIPYYEDPLLRHRTHYPPPSVSDKVPT
jgi:type IV secretion system protein VirD4